MPATKPIVAIVGRPNVGKSTLFNRMVGRRISIVEARPGVTRDRIVTECSWAGSSFALIDTGGIEFGGEGEVAGAIRRQAALAVATADVIVLVVDGRAGVTPSDREVAQLVRRSGKTVVLAANKMESSGAESAAYECYSLGLGDPVLISAEHGRNVGDLLDAITTALPSAFQEDPEGDQIRVAVVGRPNAGKSSLVNRLLGEERVIVSSVPGTTRDAIDTELTWNDRKFVLVDTAGLRRPGRRDPSLERYSALRAARAVERADVGLLVIDAALGVTEQDQRISGTIVDAGRGIVLLVNKWDAVEKRTETMDEYRKTLRQKFPHLSWAPALFISARTGKRIDAVLDMAERVAEQHARRITTGRLNDVIREAVGQHHPPSDKGVPLRIYYAVQRSVQPPTILLFTNRPDLLHFSYRRYLRNRLRDVFGFQGTPVIIEARGRR